MMVMAKCHPDKKHVAKGFCGACYAKFRRMNPETKRKQKESQKKWYIAHPDYERERSKRRWATNPEPLRKAHNKWINNHPEKRREYKIRWKTNNPEQYVFTMRAQVKKRKALKRGATISNFTSKQWELIKQLHNYSCFYCGSKPDRLDQDHCIPLSRGGTHTLSNIVPSCTSCNSRKGRKTLEEYLRCAV